MKSAIVGFLLSICFAVSASATYNSGSHKIRSVELEPAVACLGEEVGVTVQVELDGKFYSVQKWGSTSIDGVCFEHDNHQSSDGKKTFNESFTIVAPGDQGLGNLQIKTFKYDNCFYHEKTENVDLETISCVEDGEDGTNCWDSNENGVADLPDEDVNNDGQVDVLDCRGADGDDCTIEQVRGGAKICCGETCFTIFDGEDGVDGEDGEDGEDGLGCTVRPKRHGGGYVIECGDGTSVIVRDGRDGEDGEDGLSCWDLNGNGEKDFEADTPWWCYFLPWKPSCRVQDFTEDTNSDGTIDVLDCRGMDGEDGADGLDGINCWDLNGNEEGDFCHPRLASLFDGLCPTRDDFFVEYECEVPPENANKAMLTAREYNGLCGAVLTCEEYLLTTTNADAEAVSFICDFTEDSNRDEVIDAFDCQGNQGNRGGDGEDGEDGRDGRDGTDGADGVDGQDGQDGENCDVIDNLDATCTIACPGSEVFVYECGVGAEPVETNSSLCGSFGGITVVAMLLPLGFMRFRRRRYSC